jgi:hypothetical protein
MHDWRNPERVAPWKPRQKFHVTALGHEAGARYHQAVETAQKSADPRGALEQAKRAWATEYNLRPDDGILLEDMVAGHTSLAELKGMLDSLNLTLRDARGTLDRLVAARLIEALEL